MSIDNENLFRLMEIDEDVISSIKYTETSPESYYLFKIKQKSNIFEEIKNIDVIFQIDATFSLNFTSNDLNETLDQYTYSDEFNDNEIFRYYKDNFSFDPIKNYSENSNRWSSSIISFKKSDLFLLDEKYIYFLLSSEDSAFLKNLIVNCFVRIIVKNTSNKIIFDSSFIEKDLNQIYLDTEVDTQNFIFEFVFNQYMSSSEIVYDNSKNQFKVNLPSIKESFITNISGAFYYNDTEYTIFNNIPKEGNLSGVTIELGDNTLTYDILNNYNNNLSEYKFDFYVTFNTQSQVTENTSNSDSFSRLITKSYNISDRTIKQIIVNNNDLYQTNNLKKIVLSCDADYIEDGEVIKLVLDYDLSDIDTTNVYVKEVIINNDAIYDIYKTQELKNNFTPLYTLAPISDYFNVSSSFNSTELYISAKNIYSISNINIVLEYNDGKLINTKSIIKSFDFSINKSITRTIQIEKFFKLEEFNQLINDSLDIDINKSISFSKGKSNIFEVKNLQIKNVNGFDTLASNFNYDNYSDDVRRNIELFIKSTFCNISIKTTICGIEFYKNVYGKLSEVGDFSSNSFVFDKSFLDKITVDINSLIRTLSLKNKQKFAFLLETSKQEMLDAINDNSKNFDKSINITQAISFKIIPLPFEVSRLINVGIDIDNNIYQNENKNLTEDEVRFATFIFYSFIYQISPNLPYDNFINIKKSYFSSEYSDDIFITSFFEFIYDKYTKSKSVFKILNSLNKSNIISDINSSSPEDFLYYKERPISFEAEVNILKQKGITKTSFYKNNFLSIISRNRKLNSYSSVDNTRHSIRTIKSDIQTKNIKDVKDLMFINNDNIMLKADIVDFISEYEEIKKIDLNFCIIPFVTSLHDNNIRLVKDVTRNDKDLVVDESNKTTLSPSRDYFYKYNHLLKFTFNGVSKKDFLILNKKNETHISLKTDANIVSHNLFKMNHYAYLSEFFRLCATKKFNILSKFEFIYSINIETNLGNFYKKDYSFNLLEKLDKKIYIIDNLESIVFIKTNEK